MAPAPPGGRRKWKVGPARSTSLARPRAWDGAVTQEKGDDPVVTSRITVSRARHLTPPAGCARSSFHYVLMGVGDGGAAMATYHVTASPRAGISPTGSAPLAPMDITASNDEEAQREANGLLGECIGEYGEHLYEGHGEAAVAAFGAWADQWQALVRRVYRPSVDVTPRSWTTDAMYNGKVVGTHFHYGEETGEQAFDVLVGGTVAGLLVEGRRWLPAPEGDGHVREIRVWRLRSAMGVLASLTGRQWDEDGPVERNGLAWPDAALGGIRAELENKATTACGRRPAQVP
jgi:hypothetical protein